MNQLDTFLRDGAMTAKTLAEKVGVSQPYISDLRRNKRCPSDAVAKRIETATDGQVKASAWKGAA